MSLLHLERVSFTHRGSGRPALREVDLEVEPGERVGLLGASGAGKSTLCYLPNGLIPHFLPGQLRGTVRLKGRDSRTRRVAEAAAEVGLVMEDFESQIVTGRVDLEVAFAPESLGLPREEIGRRIARYLESVGLAGLEHRDPATLSGGQRQRLVLASVLAGEPDLLVLDEPSSDLDPRGRRELARALACTDSALLIAEPHPSLLADMDRLVLLAEGERVAEGSPRELLSDDALLARAGLPRPPLAELFARLGATARPLTVEEALAAWDTALAADAAGRLAALDRRRAEGLGPPVLEVEGLHYSYPDGVRALEDVDLSVRRGEVVALLGPNGSGKTTLARHLVGLLTPDRGQVRVQGPVGYLFQNPDHQIYADTVLEEVSFGWPWWNPWPARAARCCSSPTTWRWRPVTRTALRCWTGGG